MKKFIKCCGGCMLLLWATLLAAQPRINLVEYYIDHDPGYGNGKPIKFTAGNDLSGLSLDLNPSVLNYGAHVFGIRAKDENGAWSPDNKWLLARPYPAAGKPGKTPGIKQVEYYIDVDPGYGNGVPVAISITNNLADSSLAVNISGLSKGAHNLFIRSKDVKNSWSTDNIFPFNVDTIVASPSIVVNSIARKNLCQQDSVDISYQATGSYSTSNVFNAELSDSAGNFDAATIIGSYTGTDNSIIRCAVPPGLPGGAQYKIRIESTNPVVTGLPATDSIKVSNLPAPLITPTDTIVINNGDSIKLAATSGYKNYLWSTNAKSATIQVKDYGSYTVKVTDKNGCSATSAPVQVNVTPFITATDSLTDLCPGINVTLTSSAAKNYLWNTADTSQSILATTTGSYYVVVNGGSKGDTSASVNVTFKSCGRPDLLSATNITDTSATLNWGGTSCAQNYQLRYQSTGTGTWNYTSTNNLDTSYTLTGLSASTTYQWQVRTVCLDSPKVVGSYSIVDSFTTSGSGIAARAFTATAASDFTAVLYPNPATRSATLQVAGSKTKTTVLITDIAGRILWQKHEINGAVSLPVESFSAGTYLVIIKNENHHETLKLIKN